MKPRSSSRASGARPSGRGTRGPASARNPRSGGSRREPPSTRPAAPSRAFSRPPASIDRILATQKWDSLVPLIERAGADPGAALDLLKRFTRGLLEWNRAASNLISGADEARVVERHVAESLEPAQWLRNSSLGRWMDLGSGGGFPALPLAICGIGERWTLVESRRTKTLFLRKFLQESQLKNIDVVNDRIENLLDSTELSGQFDGFTSRATIKLGPTLESARHFVRVGGEAFLWKGSGREQEMEDDPNWREHWRLEGTLEIGSGLAVVCRFIREK